jgi:hypothetical protein
MMNNSTVRSCVVLVAIAVLALGVTSVSLKAQSVSLVVKVPFAFQAGDKTLPAGTYTLKRRAMPFEFGMQADTIRPLSQTPLPTGPRAWAMN